MANNIKGKPVKNTLVGTEAFPIDDTGNDRHALLSAVRAYVLGTLSTDDISVLNDGVVTQLGNLTEHLSHHASPYIASGGVVTDNGDGTINITAGEVWIKINNALDADFEAFAVAEDDIAITANQNIIVYVDYNAGSPIYAVMQSVAGYFYSNWDTVPFATVVNTGSSIIINDFKDTATNGIYKNILSQINYQPFRYLGGLSASDGGTRNPVITAGALLFSNDYLAITGLDTTGSGTFTRMYVTAGTWTRTASQTAIDNTQYNNTTTGLVNISNNKFAKKYLYFIKDTPSFWVVLEGQAEYDTLSEAQDAGVPSTLPPELSAFYAGSILIAAFIVKQGQAAFQDIQNPFVTPFTSSAASLHNNLGGIESDTVSGTYVHLSGAKYKLLNKTQQTLTSSASISMNVENGLNAYLSLAHNATLTLSNLVTGAEGNIVISNTGSYTITISPTPDVFNGGAGAITLTASSKTIISYYYDGTDLNINYANNYN